MSFRPRVIPTLLLKEGALVKGRRFRRHEYVGDPVNAVRMFDTFGADELVLLDIGASRARRPIDPELIRSIGEESGMPLAVGGGIRDLEAGRALIQAGAEKLVINEAWLDDPSVLSRFADEFGSSSIIAGIDVLTRRGRSRVYRHTT
ncbi:MAG: imidazole glycerol phosphate synthase subunit HisF, partial [Acidimicrobiia bacterium]|nr:imidazole glycerol phosphate synthase subunit HisF [Acidimicrobiia bacterium]